MSEFEDRPAFPTAFGDNDGMTLRDYFAAQAFVLWTPELIALLGPDPQQTAKLLAHGCYQIADAMLMERAK